MLVERRRGQDKEDEPEVDGDAEERRLTPFEDGDRQCGGKRRAGGEAAARSLVDQMNAGHPFTLTLTSLSGDLDRGSVVTATVEVTMPLIIFPGVIEVDVADYTASHQEEVDLFRSLP